MLMILAAAGIISEVVRIVVLVAVMQLRFTA
jgi:hypothetical protein